MAGDHAAKAPARRPGADPPERAGARPLQLRLRRGASPRRLRARRLRRRSRADPDRDRQRGVARGRRLRGTALRRRASARGQPALLVPVRPPAGRVSRERPAAGRTGAGGRGAGIDAGVGPLRGAAGADRRHAHLRRLGAAEGGAAKASASRRSGWRRRRGSFWHEAHAVAARAGPEPVARQHHAHDAAATARSSATSTSSRSPG